MNLGPLKFSCAKKAIKIFKCKMSLPEESRESLDLRREGNSHFAPHWKTLPTNHGCRLQIDDIPTTKIFLGYYINDVTALRGGVSRILWWRYYKVRWCEFFDNCVTSFMDEPVGSTLSPVCFCPSPSPVISHIVWTLLHVFSRKSHQT